ncbi:alpha-2-macroglobulin [Roseateles sp. BYS180W]|uniref:Alpha-2-macroglobulin n=1 Tax=Roseateles rivi TaxID=3299028 RepID=A0ABW7FYE9_9BURK
MGAWNKGLKAVGALGVAAALLAGGWWGWKQGPGQVTGEGEEGSAAAFALVDCKPRMFDGAPALAVSFTQPLARDQDFARLLSASESGPDERPEQAQPLAGRWVLGDNPRVLYLPYVKPERKFRVKLDAALAARAGATLATPQQCEALSEAMPDAYYFASRGTVLPAEINGGLPVVTVNTPEVDVQFLRIRPERLSEFLDQVGGQRQASGSSHAGEGDEEEGGYHYEDPGRRLKGSTPAYVLDELRAMADSVYIGRFSTDERPNRRNVSFLPVERIAPLQEPGIYVAVMNAPGRFGWDYQVTHFYVTDIGLHLRRHAAQLDVFATSLKQGTALSGIELTLVDAAGKALQQVKSDGQGHGVFTQKLDQARVVLARRGDKEMSVLSLRDAALDLSEFDAVGHPSRNNKLFVYAGRDLYRPGERLQVSVLGRDADGRAWAKPLPLTLNLKKPDGSNAQTLLARPHASGTGYYQETLNLPADAPTGRWLLQARVDPAAKQPDAQWSFQVEEFLPERLKLQLTAPEAVMLGAGELNVAVQGDYLYGAPAAGNRVLASLHTERQTNPLARQLPGFIFGDFADDNAKKRTDAGEVQLDEQGRSSLSFTPELAERRSPMLLRTSVSLLESGGRPVVRSLERSWWPAEQLLAIRPLFDRHVVQEGSLAQFELTRVDAAGRFKPAADLQLKLINEERQWYWRYDDGRGWNSGFNSHDELVEARQIKLDKRSTLALPVRWGRYRLEITDPSTRQTLRYAFYAGWGAQDADDVGNRPDRVQLKLEGAPFKPGQTARLAIKPPHDGQAVVTVEGDRVLWSERLAVKASGTTLEIPVAEDWKRHDLYITVAAFRPGNQGDKVTPARALGLVHLPLWREDRKPKVELKVPAKTKPEQVLPVLVKAPQLAGQAAMVTVSAVDVGILNITRYKTPDPQDFFFGKHRYGADLLDLYGKLIEKMEGNAARQRFGGDAGQRDTQSLPRKVLLVDLFSGPVKLNAQGEATVPLSLPDFNGTLRVMAVVASADSYGSAEAETVVAAPLVAELSLPRFLAPGDKASIALDVSNLSGSPREVKARLEADGPLRVTAQPGAVQLADKQRQVLTFQVEATEAAGLVPLRLLVQAGDLKLKREAALQLQPLTPLQHDIKRMRLEPGATLKLDAGLLAPYWPGSASASLSVSEQPPINLREQVKGLFGYPYGCLEQTTSAAYPLALIDDDSAKAHGLKPLAREERVKRLDLAFGRLASMQQPKGGFGLWSSSDSYEAWLSAYVTGFLQDAKEAGFAPPEALYARATDHLLEQFQRSPNLQLQPRKAEPERDSNGRVADERVLNDLRQAHQRLAEAAHAGYVLARAQKAPLAVLRTLYEQYRGNARSPLPLIHLGLALKLMGDEARAKQALDEGVRRSYGINPTTGADAWGEWLGDYGSRVRDQAMAYALLHRHAIAHERREGLLYDLVPDLEHRRYLSTQERLALLLAVRSAQGQSDAPGWRASLQTAAAAPEVLAGQGVQQRELPAAKLSAGLVLKNEGKGALFVEVQAQGYTLKPPPARDDAIRIERQLFSVDGKPVSARSFVTGEMLIVRLRATAARAIKDGLIVDRIPAGFEVENLNLSQGPQAGEFSVEGTNIGEANASARIVHTEFRDDRFVAAARLDGRPLEVFYLLRAVTPGRYQVPAPFAEDMYRPELRGVGKAEADITVHSKK